MSMLAGIRSGCGTADWSGEFLKYGDRNPVRDERMGHSVTCADKELCDLHRGKGALDGSRDPDVEGSQGVVEILEYVSQGFWFKSLG